MVAESRGVTSEPSSSRSGPEGTAGMSGPELDALRNSGHPFFGTRWRADEVGMVIDDDVDWAEVAELLTESYCLLAPKKLAALVDRPTS